MHDGSDKHVSETCPAAAVPVFCLTLERAIERQRAFADEAARAGLKFEYCFGVDARVPGAEALLPQPDMAAARARLGRAISLPEVAAAHGHHCLFERLLETDAPGAVVFEDDVRLDAGITEVIDRVCAFMAGRSERRELVLLGGLEGFEHCPLLVGRRSAVPLSGPWRLLRVLRSRSALQRSCGYYVSRGAARSMLASERPITAPPDVWGRMLAARTLERVFIVDPPVVRHPPDSVDSIVETARTQARERAWAERREREKRLSGLPVRVVRAFARQVPWRQAERRLYVALSRWL